MNTQCSGEYLTKKEIGNYQRIVAFCVVTSIPHLPDIQEVAMGVAACNPGGATRWAIGNSSSKIRDVYSA